MKCVVKGCKTEGGSELFQKTGFNLHGNTRCKECKAKADKKYALKNKEKLAAYYSKRWRTNERARLVNRQSVSHRRFNLDADQFVKDKKCSGCGMTNAQHIEKWGERLNINHKNNAGRKSMRLGMSPDNRKNNLEPLCRACHCGVSNKQRHSERMAKSA